MGNDLIEVKFSGWDVGLKEHHKMQCEIYCNLYGVEKMLLWVFSPKGYKEYVVNAKYDDSDILGLIENRGSPMWKWECKYCKVREACKNEV